MDGRITVRFDGGSRGNPGPAGAGIVLEADDGTPLVAFGRFLGQATSNVAEYRGLIAGLEKAKSLGVKHLRVLGDSELVIKQLLGEYRVRNETLKPLYARAMSLLGEFPRTEIGHNRRAANTLADSLANLAMDKSRDVTDDELPASLSFSGSENASEDPGPGPPARLPAADSRAECPRCGCRIVIEHPGSSADSPRRFICRCGTAMRPTR
jgi:ribonuclease HI